MIRASSGAAEGLKLKLTFENGVSHAVDFLNWPNLLLFGPLTNDEFLEALALSGTAELYGEKSLRSAPIRFSENNGKAPRRYLP